MLRFCVWPAAGALFELVCERSSCAALQAAGAGSAAAHLISMCCGDRPHELRYLLDKHISHTVWAACGVLLRLAQAAAADAAGGIERIGSLMRGDGAGAALVRALKAHSGIRRIISAAAAALEVMALMLPEAASELRALGAAEPLSDFVAMMKLAGFSAKSSSHALPGVTAASAAVHSAALARCERLLGLLSA